MVHTSDSEEISKEKEQNNASWIAVLRDLRVFVWAHFQSKGGAIRNNDFCPRFPRINETIRLRAKFTTDDSDLS